MDDHVSRRGDRLLDHAIQTMHNRFNGRILFIRVRHCRETGALVRFLPSPADPYHTEIHGSSSCALLSKSQRLHLARKAVLCG